MEIRGNPISFSAEDIITVALFFGVSFADIEKCTNQILLVNDATYLHLLSKYRTNEVSLTQVSSFIITKDFLYVKSYAETNLEYYLIAMYVSGKYGQTEINNAFRVFEAQQSKLNDIQEYQSYIAENYSRIIAIIDSMQEFQPFDFNKLVKMGKKFKVKITQAENLYQLEFGKCSSGNEIEGHIQYKNVIMFVDSNFRTKRIRYYFNNWYYDTNWSIRGLQILHPHIDGLSVCFGNRSSDFASYIKGNHYEFLIDLYKDTLNSYNPESPFRNISKIAKLLKMISKALPLVPPEKYNSEEAKSRRLLTFAMGNVTTCPYCNDYLLNGICCNEECIGNPASHHTCSNCSTPMIWNENLHRQSCPKCYYCNYCRRYSTGDHCLNAECEHSPLYIKYCQRCGLQVVRVTNIGWQCQNNQCAYGVGYRSARPRLTSPPPCRICGSTVSMLSNSGGEWFCRNPLHTNNSQYDAYGAHLGGRYIYGQTELYQHRLAENELYCPQCHADTELRDDSYYCTSPRCTYSQRNIAIFNIHGHYLLNS